MSDVHSKKVRSYNMSKIRAKNTKPELLVRKFLFKNRFRYRLHVKGLPGKPDIVFTRRRIAIFIHGCFWHGHENCKYFRIPKTREQWWTEKISRNRLNDQSAEFQLERLCYKIIIIWECELKPKNIFFTLQNLKNQLIEQTNEISKVSCHKSSKA